MGALSHALSGRARRRGLSGRIAACPAAARISELRRPPMGKGIRASVAWLVILSLLLPACASRHVTPIGPDRKAFKPEPAERALWPPAGTEEQSLLEKAKASADPQLA